MAKVQITVTEKQHDLLLKLIGHHGQMAKNLSDNRKEQKALADLFLALATNLSIVEE